MIQRFTVSGRLDGLNEYTKACRAGKYAGGGMKKRNQDAVRASIRMAGLSPMSVPVRVSITWRDRPNRQGRHRDRDNIAFAKKFVLDALVAEGVIADDDWNSVDGFTDEFEEFGWDEAVVTVEEV